MSSLGGDYYIYDETARSLFGERTGKGYQLADRVEVRLIEVASGRTEWSERFEQAPMDPSALQDAIAARVATSLPRMPALGAGLHSYRPRAAEAYFLQLEARAHLKPFTRLPLIKALTLFEQALAIDPDYAMP